MAESFLDIIVLLLAKDIIVKKYSNLSYEQRLALLKLVFEAYKKDKEC